MEWAQSMERKRSLGLDDYESGSGESSPIEPETPPRKRLRTTTSALPTEAIDSSIPPANGDNYLVKLSDELLVRILKSLDVKQILRCRFVDKKWRELASDGEIWRGLYWEKFVSKRKMLNISLDESPRSKQKTRTLQRGEDRRWARKELDWVRAMRKKYGHGESGFVNRETEDRTPWMAKYKLSTNWLKGRAQRSVVKVAAKHDTKVLSQMRDGIQYTADANHGLRAWDLSTYETSPFKTWDEYIGLLAEHGQKPAQTPLHAIPTAMALDTSPGIPRLAIGFEDGTWELWRHTSQPAFTQLCISDTPTTPTGAIVKIASHNTHITTITTTHLFTLHSLPPSPSPQHPISKPTILDRRTSHTAWPPYALSLRPTPSSLIASIAYSIPSLSPAWSVGVQELHVNPENGSVVDARLATSVQSGWFPAVSANPASTGAMGLEERGISKGAEGGTMSYSIPHLVVGRESNSVTKYTVESTSKKLGIESATAMRPCTAGVVGVDVGGENRLVTVQKGGAVGVTWLLPGGGRRERTVVVDSGARDVERWPFVDDERWEEEWVGSDEERIVVVGRGRMVIYDFR